MFENFEERKYFYFDVFDSNFRMECEGRGEEENPFKIYFSLPPKSEFFGGGEEEGSKIPSRSTFRFLQIGVFWRGGEMISLIFN